MSTTAGETHWNVAELYTLAMGHVPHEALAVSGLVQTGVAAGQSAADPDPALPRHTGVAHAPFEPLHTWPPVH